MKTSALVRRAAAAALSLAAGAALAHPGHPAVGGPLDHVHADAAAPDTLIAMALAGVLSVLLLGALKRVAPQTGWRGALVGAVQGAAMAGVAVGASGVAMLLAQL